MHRNIPFDPAETPYLEQVGELLAQETEPYAWHPTSVQAIMNLAQTGQLLPSGIVDEGFEYYPVEDDPGSKHAKTQAANYGRANLLMRALPFEFPDPFDIFDAHDAPIDSIEAVLVLKGVNLADWEILKELTSRTCAGVLVGVPDLVEELGYSPVVYGPQHHYEHLVDGVPIDLIQRIQPLGEYDRQVMSNLKQGLPPDDIPRTPWL